MKLLGYIRVSTKEQAEQGHSLEAQRASIVRYCDLYDHELVDVIVDGGTSAFTTRLKNRKGGGELVQRLNAGEATGFVFTRLDRVFRNALDGLTSLEWLDKRDISLHCIEQRIDTTTPDGEFMFIVSLGSAQRDSRMNSARCKEVSRHLQREGRAYGPTPYGFRNVDGMLNRDRDTWQIRCLIVDARKDGMTFREIAAKLRTGDIAPPSGNGRNWPIATIRNICKTHHELEHIGSGDTAHEAQVSKVASSPTLPGQSAPAFFEGANR